MSLISPAVGRGYTVVVSKKVARLSVTRHLIKRRVLALLRAAPHKPAALLVLLKPSAVALSYAELRVDLYNLLPKIAE